MLANGTGTLRHFGGQLDHAYQIGKESYQIARPLLKMLAPELEEQTTRTLQGAASGYEFLRDGGCSRGCRKPDPGLPK